MPKNCSNDVSKVINYVDKILKGDDAVAKQSLKEKFGLGGIVHDDDFARCVSWQQRTFFPVDCC